MISCYKGPGRHQTKSGLRVAVVLALFVSINILSHQAAFAQFAGAFAWGNNATADSYTPSATFSYSSISDSTDSEATITRSAVGVYNVTFAGLENVGVNGGHVQVSGYGSDTTYCGVGSWGANSTSVHCFDAAGVAADARFTVAFLKPEADTPGIAYAWANNATADSYTASATFSYNPGGSDVAITRSATGIYAVAFPGYDPTGIIGGHVQVSSYGGTNSSCSVSSWGAESVSVHCFDPVGDPVDERFTILYTKPEVGSNFVASAWANNSSSDTYTPDTFYSYNPTSAPMSITRSGVGTYSVAFDDFGAVGYNGGNVLVTAYGGGAERCKVTSWSSGAANILCLDTAGNPIDARYTVMFWKPEEPRIPKELNGVSFAWANDATAAAYTPDLTYLINESGLNATISRSGSGQYNVLFDGLVGGGLNGGTVQASVYGSASQDCQVRNWNNQAVNVGCFDQSGAAADARYSVLFISPTEETTGLAYAWADNATSDSYSPAANYSYNSTGGATTVTRSAVGRYSVAFEGYETEGVNGGHVQVTSYGSAGERCNTNGWTENSVGVSCFDVAGSPADATYSVLFLKPEADTPGMAYAWANQSTVDSYTPSDSYSYNSGGGAITATRSGPGAYSISFAGYDGVGANGGNVQVSAYGSTGARCSVSSWSSSGVNIACVDASGAAVDSQYDVLFLKPTQNTGTAIEDEVADLDDPSTLINFPNPFSGTTTITYSLKTSAPVELTVHDITGRLVNKLVDSVQSAGEQSVVFDASGLSAGLYFYRLNTADRVQVGKMTVGW